MIELGNMWSNYFTGFILMIFSFTCMGLISSQSSDLFFYFERDLLAEIFLDSVNLGPEI